ncbi:uncharacterized protein LOC108049626 [Drosophila rhopaloa]|uniref:Uncharacterized protein n=1 Tax=Drosophila rhopaloa TaxID=1041015 RepID=A0ABM5HWE5_DRORH|nr:uncharacterized protein LOC108049626 [Drosophila rhopaloa]
MTNSFKIVQGKDLSLKTRFRMTEDLEEFITLTPLTCVQQCNALLGARSTKPKSCIVFFTLFGAYCGVLVYRAYRAYASKQGGNGEKISEVIALEAKADDLNVEPGSSLVNELLEQAQPILLQPVELSSTDMRWRYCSQLPEPEFKLGSDGDDEEFEESSIILDENDHVTVSAATSTTKPKNLKPTTFSV